MADQIKSLLISGCKGAIVQESIQTPGLFGSHLVE